ncbi:MAG TPA: hypothetical protein VK892_03935 [Pyrinomonadaceae bacterium]|nr:hypothetical protein [Pyrinomonadaceae bacterium]
MSSIRCRCGYITDTTVYPSPHLGELKWQTETESESEERSRDVKDFFVALDKKQDKNWVRNYFGESYAESYPDSIGIANVIEDITSRASFKGGRCIEQCEKCERIYIQKEFYSDEWTCFEKAE